jgi:hypothetical protein
VSRAPRIYHVFVVPRERPTLSFIYHAEFDGTTVTITRSSLAIR